MTLFESLSIAAVAIGGVWTLIHLYFSQKFKLENQKIRGTTESIRRLESLVHKLEMRLSDVENKWGNQFETMGEKIMNLKIAMVDTSHEIRSAKASIDGTSKSLNIVFEKVFERSQVKEIGEGLLRVESKNKK